MFLRSFGAGGSVEDTYLGGVEFDGGGVSGSSFCLADIFER